VICRLSWHSPSHRREQAQLCPIICKLSSHGLSHRRVQRQNAAQLFFLRCLGSEISNHRFLLFPRIPCPKNCCSTLFATVHNKCTRGGQGCCVSPSKCQAPLTPAVCMFVFCLLSFLHLHSPPVRLIGQACMDRERWCLNRDLTMGELEA
jgi:hypothetical protein